MRGEESEFRIEESVSQDGARGGVSGCRRRQRNVSAFGVWRLGGAIRRFRPNSI